MFIDDTEEPVAVTNFRKYLRIPTVQPDVNYEECVHFLSQLAENIGLPVQVINVHENNPVVIMTFEGTDPRLSSILLNSHMDVVPVHAEKWSYPPFAAVKDAKGNIYGRGAQDIKCIGIQFVEAVRRYVNEKVKLKRTIHICFVPDEEAGGKLGMKKFIQTEQFKKLNIGFALDEGGASPTEDFTVDWAQRSCWQFDINCYGVTGHGSMLNDDIAAKKFSYVLERSLKYRNEQKSLLENNPRMEAGKITSINMTMISGGLLANVVPDKLTATFDVRVGINSDHEEMEKLLLKWCNDAGAGVELKFRVKEADYGVTRLDDNNPWWMAFKAECDKMGLVITPQICPASTDSRFLRQVGIPCLGFSPMNNTPFLFHDHDEFLNETTFVKGIDIFYNIIKGLASV